MNNKLILGLASLTFFNASSLMAVKSLSTWVTIQTSATPNTFLTLSTAASISSAFIKPLGLTNKEVESAIRFSFSYENTKEEVDYTINVLKKSLMFLRRVKRWIIS